MSSKLLLIFMASLSWLFIKDRLKCVAPSKLAASFQNKRYNQASSGSGPESSLDIKLLDPT